MSLRDATQSILASEDPANWLQLADMYIGSFNQMHSSFVLPAQHKVLAPIIEAFHDDGETFIKYIKAIRDQYQPGSHKSAIQAVYRTILTRVVQQGRRARLARALAVTEAVVGRPLEPDERARVGRKLEQHWALRRLQYLKAARGKVESGRLSSDERAELLQDFWHEIDDEISRRELPMFKL